MGGGFMLNRELMRDEEKKIRQLTKAAFKHAYRLARAYNNDYSDSQCFGFRVNCGDSIDALNTSDTEIDYDLMYEVWITFVVEHGLNEPLPLDLRLKFFKFNKTDYCEDCQETGFCICIPF